MNLNHLLQQYYLLREDMVTSSPLGRDPTASRVPSSDFSASIGLMCDVGVCLERLKPHHRTVIGERWAIWLDREVADEMVSEWGRKKLSAMGAIRRGAAKKADRTETVWIDRSNGLTSDLVTFDRRPDYIEAIRLFRVEVQARDWYARGCCGDSAGICGVGL